MSRWTDESRKAQSEKLKYLKPWLKTTGPNTQEGKKASSLNSIKHGMRSQIVKDLRRPAQTSRIFKGTEINTARPGSLLRFVRNDIMGIS